MNPIATSGLLSNRDAAQYLGIRPQTLKKWRCLKQHRIPFLRIGRAIRYRERDLVKWMASREEAA